MSKHGSDKSEKHNYGLFYHELLKSHSDAPISILEVGLGTNNPNLASTMGIHGRPGASLRGWKEFFPNASVYGADIDRDILFTEDRIKTAWVDQTSLPAISGMLSELGNESGFDMILDDGLHEYHANVNLFLGTIHSLKPGGLYIIEDVAERDFSELGVFLHTLRHSFAQIKLFDLPAPIDFVIHDNKVAVLRKKV